MSRFRLSCSKSCRWLAAITIAAGLLLWIGSVRQPADLTEPVVLQSTPRYTALPGRTMRVGVFNIHGGKGLDGHRDLARVADCLDGLDIVSLHEVRGDYHTNQAHVLGAHLDMASLFAPTEWRWGRNDFGNGLLTNVQLGRVHQIPLVMTMHTYRNAFLTSFRFGGESVQLAVVHIDLKRDRDRQIQDMSHLFLSLQPPAILMGDLNVDADHPSLSKLLARPDVHNALRYAPPNSGDWIIARGLRAVAADVEWNEASDHPLVWAELELDDTAALADAEPAEQSF